MKRRLGAVLLFVWVMGIGGMARSSGMTATAQAASGNLTRISISSTGAQSNDHTSAQAMSSDGRFVAFASTATNLVPGDTNGVKDIFVHDRQTGETSRVSVHSDGTQANQESYDPAISADGRYVAFISSGSNLIANDSNGVADVFVHDRQSGQTAWVSSGLSGAAANGASYAQALSADGRFVAFTSLATNLVSGDTNGHMDAFVHDRQTGETWRFSVSSTGAQANDPTYGIAITAGGRFVTFHSSATNLIQDDDNNVVDVFIHDRQRGITERVSVNSAGAAANSNSGRSAVSADGRFVAFESKATNLLAGEVSNDSDIFVHDRLTGETICASVNAAGVDGDSDSWMPAISEDGRFIVFESNASNLIPNDPSTNLDVYLYDRLTAVTSGLSVPPSGHTSVVSTYEAGISADGRYVSFVSDRADFVPDDSNGKMDAFIYDRGIGSGSLLGEPAEAPFLGLPFALADGAGDALQNWNLGRVRSWFDHTNPDGQADGNLTLFDPALSVTTGRGELGGQACYGATTTAARYCHEGHDGIDFEPPARGSSQPVLAAAAGTVVHVERDCQSTNTCAGLGNNVVLYHYQGYFTRYGHLAGVNVVAGQHVEREAELGTMGDSGSTGGLQLHFAVYRDVNGDRTFDSADKVVDPFGYHWPGGPASDPWVVERGGPPSYPLWLSKTPDGALYTLAEGANLANATGTIRVAVPPGAYLTPLMLRLDEAPPAGEPATGWRSTGQSFRLRVTEPISPDELPAAADAPIPITLTYAAAAMSHLNEQQATLARWDEAAAQWTPLTTTVNPADRSLHAETTEIGSFDVHAPLLCPGDSTEPDDDFMGAPALALDSPAAGRLFDIPTDEDWYTFTAVAGQEYHLAVTGTAGVSARIEVIRLDSATPLSSGFEAVSWTATTGGTYYIRLIPAAGGATGCAAGYSVLLTAGDPNNHPPNAPSSPQPTNGATEVWPGITLGWTATDPDSDPLTYEVRFGLTNPPPLVVAGQGAATYNPPGDLTTGTYYTWQIIAKDGRGGTTPGPVWSFTTAATLAPPAIYLSPTGAGKIGVGTAAKAFTNADILSYVKSSNTWDILYDGSYVRTAKNLGAFAFDGDAMLLGFSVAQPVPGLGTAAPQDLVRFTPTRTGYNNTAGTFAWFFDGSDVGLSTTGEVIDALWRDETGRLYLSVTGAGEVLRNPAVPTSAKIRFQDEDVLRFTPSSTGATTAGTWELYWDPTLITKMAAEDINGYWEDPATGHRYVTILGAFSIGNVAYGGVFTGNGTTILRFAPNAAAPGGWAPVEKVTWLAAGAALPKGFNLDGIEMGR